MSSFNPPSVPPPPPGTASAPPPDTVPADSQPITAHGGWAAIQYAVNTRLTEGLVHANDVLAEARAQLSASAKMVS